MRNHVILTMAGLIGSIQAILVDDYASYCGCIVLRIMNDTEHASLAQQYMDTITTTPNDQAHCLKWNNSSNYTIDSFPDANGQPTNFTHAVGIFAPDAYRICSPPSVKQKFIPENFASSTVGLLLPYIALCAQLGMQTGTILGDIFSIFLSLGNPVWICSSIAHAVLYRRAIHKRFEKMRRNAAAESSVNDVAMFVEQCDAAETILQSFLQAPVRLSTRPGFLSSLITLPQNHGWWLTAAEKVKLGQRKIDAAYIGQNMIAIITWLLSILADFGSIPGAVSGNPNSAEWQICMGCLFLWLFIATFGPIAIKSQYEAGSIHEALRAPWAIGNKFSIPLSLDEGGIAIVIHEHQTAIEQRSGLNHILPRNQRTYCRRNSEAQIRDADVLARKSVRIPTLLGINVGGDEGREGPIYFSARLFTSWWASEQILRGFEAWQKRTEDTKPPQSEEIVFQMNVFNKGGSTDASNYKQTIELIDLRAIGEVEDASGSPDETDSFSKEEDAKSVADEEFSNMIKDEKGTEQEEDNSRVTPEELDSSLDIKPKEITAYPQWNQISPNQRIAFALGSVFGLLALWCTCGPSLYVLYTTPPVGLGCLSGGILLYTVLATISFLSIVGSMLLSHEAVLQYQQYHIENPTHRLSTTREGLIGRYTQTFFHTMLCGASAFLNIFAKFVAVINACWVLIWSLLSYSNVMDVPYCTTAYLTLRNQGWTRLWIFSPDQFVFVAIQELASLSAASIVALCACILIYNLTTENGSQKRRWRVTGLFLVGSVTLVTVLTYLGARSIKERRGVASSLS